MKNMFAKALDSLMLIVNSIYDGKKLRARMYMSAHKVDVSHK